MWSFYQRRSCRSNCLACHNAQTGNCVQRLPACTSDVKCSNGPDICKYNTHAEARHPPSYQARKEPKRCLPALHVHMLPATLQIALWGMNPRSNRSLGNDTCAWTPNSFFFSLRYLRVDPKHSFVFFSGPMSWQREIPDFRLLAARLGKPRLV